MEPFLEPSRQRLIEDTRRYLESLYEQFPAVKAEMKRNLEKYGFPVLSGHVGGLSGYSVGNQVQLLLDSVGRYHPLEMSVAPSDPEAQHYEIRWHILTLDQQARGLRRAIDCEREQSGEAP